MIPAVAASQPDAGHPPAAAEQRTAPAVPPGQRLKESVQRLLVVLIDSAAGFAVDKVDDLADSLENVTARGGVGLSATLGAGRALLSGDNPLFAAARATYGTLGALGKTLMIIGLVLSPVLLVLLAVLLLVAAIVIAIVLVIRSATT
ncbi:hypothetical protein H7X46_14695 [Pseudonocardia sp. C8]|uniref:hypothetical protein n=1 Tax=Pseudonocardia sp. C8 TaxID=2762759 RepID=UPI0016425B5B|nr:hypothetical protein [Pseudonocardia sp. C8]MBC3192311.1 hypothetical protein [Pseudonocardia sp. C8]